MVSRGMIIGGAIVAGLAIAAMAMMIWAEPAEATIIGKPFPTGGKGDWVIDQNTQMLNEQRTLWGNVTVVNGYSLYMKSVSLSINSTTPYEHGIVVEDGGSLEVEEVTIKSDYAPNGWYFEVYGQLDVHDKVTFSNVQDGLQIYTDGDDMVTIDDMTLNAQGYSGIYIDTSNPSISNSKVYLSAMPGSSGYGIYIWGMSGDLSTPSFSNVLVKVSCVDKWTRWSNSEYEYMYLYGLFADGAYFNPLTGLEITFEARLDAMMNGTGSARLYVYVYMYGVYLTGATQLHGMADIEVRDGIYDVNANAEGGINAGSLYYYSYFRTMYNRISSDGLSTDRISGFTARNHMKTYNGNNIFVNVFDYNYGYAFDWNPSTAASASLDLTVSDIELSELDVDRLLYIPSSYSIVVQNSLFNNNDVNTYIMYYNSYSRGITFTNNEFRENTHADSYMFQGSSYRGKFLFDRNLVEGNTYFGMFRMDNNYEEVRIVGNTFRRNKEVNSGTATFFYLYYTRAKFSIESNTFQNNTFRYFIDGNNARGTIDVLRNTIRGNEGTDYLFWTQYLNAEFNLEENQIINNTFPGGFWCYYTYRTLSIIGNNISGNQIGSNAFLYTYYYIYSGFKVNENLCMDNTLTGSFFAFETIGYSQSGLSIETEGNTFINNTGSVATNSGLLYFEYINTGVTVTDSLFERNSANCIVINMPYSYYYYYGPNTNWFIFEGNEFYDNDGKCIVIIETDNNYVQVRQNKAHGNKDYFFYTTNTKSYHYVYEYISSPYRYIYMYTAVQGPDLMRIESNNISNNPGGGIYAICSNYDPQYYYYNPGNPDQEIIVKNNFLEGNGKDGWCIYLAGLYKKPSVKSNSLKGSAMGEFYGLIGPDDTRRMPFKMEYRDLDIDGGPQGLTAFGFEYVDATFYDCSLLNFTECLYAKNCEVNAWWSAIPEGSGKTEDGGRIRVYNHLGMKVTWANATGIDSGEPVNGAIVTMRGFGGAYTGAKLTQPDGTILAGDEGVIKTWESIDGVMMQYAPWNVTILANNATTAHTMHVVGDYEPPNWYPLTLWDIFLPEVIISNPQEGTLVSTPDVLGEGFLFERGSGIAIFEAQTDQDPYNWTPVYPNVLWTNIFKFKDLPKMNLSAEGAHTLSVRSKDISGNWNQSTISIVVDLTDPELTARLEFLDGTPIPYDPVKGGYFVRDKEIALNGTYSDNFSPDRDVIIRVNGVPEWIPQSMLGRIYKRVRPDQGINTYIIDATDQAGRRTSVRLYVSLDSYAPTMYIYSPLQGERTGDSIMTITGLTEPDTVLQVLVTAVAGERSYDAISEDTGKFAIDVELFEGIQKIIVTAIDSAGNPTQVSRDVTLKTDPPDFVVNQPPRSPFLTKEVKYTIIGTMTKDPDSDVYIDDQKVLNTGVFKRTLVLQEGENLVTIKAIDKVGNEKVKYVTIVRDTVKPSLTVLTPEGDYLLTRENSVLFTGTSKVAKEVVVVHKGQENLASIVSGTWATSATWTYTLLLEAEDLDQIVEVKARDEAGNEVVHSVQIVYDVIPPLLSLDSTIPTVVEQPKVEIAGETDETILTVYVNDIAFAVTGGEFRIVWPLVAGLNNITVSVMDDAGNPTERTLQITYNQPKPPVVRQDTGGWEISTVFGWILIVAAITIIVTAFIVTGQRTSRGR